MDAESVAMLFIETSGRYDLLTVDGTNNVPSARAYWYLQSAQRWLDRELGHPKEDAWIIKNVAARQSSVSFRNARYVRDVFEVSGDGENMVRISWKPEPYETGSSDEHWPFHSISFEPRDFDRTLKIRCVMYSPENMEPRSLSFWTVQHPDVLIRSMQRMTEIDMRNTQGVNDYEVPLLRDCKRIYDDMIAEEMGGPTEYWRIQ
ncbi:MAG: hypothetical protein BWY95_00636 [Bacteroidetes bacterium ADurb.BinA104]|nr:MAG: hypothetical protein BWY95_00636 [Bacteroidetes bacterium ADurb.BinA104]